MKLSMPILLVLLLLCFGVCNIHCSTVPENSTDMLSLLDFKKALTLDPAGVLNYWNKSTPFCQWKGVRCSSTHPGRVVMLDLGAQRLVGPISSSLGNLTFLRILNLSTNGFVGEIPPLNRLNRLQVLDLSINSLQGIIPDTLTNCTNLKKLNLSKNSLSGGIPPRIDFLSNLSVLQLKKNSLTGVIPPTLRNITGLIGIALAFNQLTGSIPDELGQLSNLFRLALGGNMLSGTVPESIFNRSSLQILDLNSNSLGKTLPPNIGDALPYLQFLLLGSNMFEGLIPASLGNASGLSMIDLSSNSFTGQVPSSFGRLLDLTFLNLEKNKLEAMDGETGEFLYALTNCTSLQTLSLRDNQLHGVIPNSIGNLSTSLQYLLLGGNNLSGIVPSSIGNFRDLLKLELDFNDQLTGTIDAWLGKLTNLQVLDLEVNNFIGPIPSSIGNLTALTTLSLGNNKFEGPIPPSLGDLAQLSVLTLAYNNLQGNIPLEVGYLKQLTELHLSSNRLTEEIPDTLGQCQSLVTVQMDQNFLTANIPISLGNILGLIMLNLSHNNLSGTIPATLSALTLLRSLDLSYNHLHGEIPRNGVFANATDVSLDSNWGLCGGALSLHMPSCPTASRKISRQYYLVRVLIPIFGFMSLLLLVYFILLEKKTIRRKYLELPYFGQHFQKVSYKDLAQATRNFSESNLIGRGSHGSVYRGKLKEPKMEVAVKVFDLEMRGAERSFMSECEALRSIQHRNLLPIITACSTVDNTGNVFKALVYEFMPNGNLDGWLHSKGEGKTPKFLDLSQRISIAVNMSDALDYLHHDCGRPTIHCDLKPSNILLDEDMNALLGDFGIARFYVNSSLASPGSISSIGVKGTIGYIAPEYAQGGHASTSGDVYSFGIVLLEMMTGKRPTDPMFKDGLDLVNFVEGNFPHQIYHVIDAHLNEKCKDFAEANMISENVVQQCLASLLQVALSCVHPSPSERMNMKEVASKMHAIKTSYLGCKSKK